MAHRYVTKSGKVLPSVTTIIGDVLGEDYRWWYASLKKQGIDPDQHLKELGIIGTICHYRVLSQVSPIPIDMPDYSIDEYPADVQVFADLFEMMWKETGLRIRRATCERFGFDESAGYCGTFDLNGLVTGEVHDKRTAIKYQFNDDSCLIDLKTSKEAKEKHFLQLGGYYNLIKEPIQYGLVVCLCPYSKKNPHLIPKIYVLNKEELEDYRDKFLAMVREWWSKNA